jgi:DNA-binding response OmpR family regulator
MLIIMKICIIDDNTSITGMFSKLLKMEGHEVVVANGGKAGLVLLDNDLFDEQS